MLTTDVQPDSGRPGHARDLRREPQHCQDGGARPQRQAEAAPRPQERFQTAGQLFKCKLFISISDIIEFISELVIRSDFSLSK